MCEANKAYDESLFVQMMHMMPDLPLTIPLSLLPTVPSGGQPPEHGSVQGDCGVKPACTVHHCQGRDSGTHDWPLKGRLNYEELGTLLYKSNRTLNDKWRVID